jgi:hypothetical protein
VLGARGRSCWNVGFLMGLCMIRWLLSNPLPRVTQSLAFPRTIFSIRPILRSAQQDACCNSSSSSIFRRILQTPRSRWSPKLTSVNAQCCTWKCREHDGDDHHGCWQQTPLSLSLSILSDVVIWASYLESPVWVVFLSWRWSPILHPPTFGIRSTTVPVVGFLLITGELFPVWYVLNEWLSQRGGMMWPVWVIASCKS